MSVRIDTVRSRENAVLKDVRRLLRDPGAYRRQGQLWLEGDHLCQAAVARGWRLQALLVRAGAWPAGVSGALVEAADRVLVVDDNLWRDLSSMESAPDLGGVVAWAGAAVSPGPAPSVVLDRLQDAGNVGSILRCAAAFGFTQVLAIKGTASLWSPKVLRAGMGAHFGLTLIEGLSPSDVAAIGLPLLLTSSHEGQWLHQTLLPWPCAWVFGHEGQGVAPDWSAQDAQRLRIVQPGGEESLNVAAAAAICLHASASARAGAGL